MRDFIDFVKDIVTILVGGIIENRAEIKVSEKRREFFKHKGNKISALFFYGSVIAAVVLAIFGIIELVKGKALGVICWRNWFRFIFNSGMGCSRIKWLF